MGSDPMTPIVSVATQPHPRYTSIMASDWRTADDDIIGRVLAGERNAYRLLVERYGSRLHAFCRLRMHSSEDADDAAQEVFIRAFNSLHKFRRGESFPAWLFAIAANHLRTRFRILSFEHRKLDRAGSDTLARSVATGIPMEGAKGGDVNGSTSPFGADNVPDTPARDGSSLLDTGSSTDPAILVEESIRAETLRRAVGALKPDMRWTVEFYYYAGFSVAETARVLGIGEEAVKTRLFRARKALRIALEGRQPVRGSRGRKL